MNENTVTCPNCGRKLKIVGKNGELRKTIYCRCRDKYGHVSINWIAGTGYNYIDDEMNLVPVF